MVGYCSVSLRTFGIALLLMLAPIQAAWAEYKLAPGDIVEFTAAGILDLKHQSTIAVDGTAGFPLIGQVSAAGLTLRELRSSVQNEMGNRVYRRISEDGREQPVVISADEVTLSIAEYRPVFINGDVSKPGQQPFRPGLTVRQAVALAGGYDFVRFRMDNPFLEQADLKSEYESLWVAFARDQAIVARLKAELENKSASDNEGRVEAPLSKDLVAEIEGLEATRLRTRAVTNDSEIAYLKIAIEKENGRVGVLTEQQQKERAGTEADAQELARVQGLFDKGAVPITRVVDARRSILLSSTRFLQTAAQQAQVERERDELAHKLDQFDETRSIALMGELQEANTALATTRARLQSVGEKLAYAGMLRSQLVSGEGAEPEIVIFRSVVGKSERIVGSQDVTLLPGDAVEVALRQFRPLQELGSRAN